MKINEVMSLTGLTKKALNYYEDKGLINPPTNAENNYRDYGEEEIEKLKIIAALRSFGFTVKDIKSVVDRKQDLKDLLNSYIENMNNQILELQRNKVILNNALNKTALPFKNIAEEMMNLKEIVEMDEKKREGYMQKSLLRIFPGVYGKCIALVLNRFLSEPVDTEEKNKAWLHIVEVLDTSPNLKLTKDIEKHFEDFTEEEWNRIKANLENKINEVNDVELPDEILDFSNLELTDPDIKYFEMFLHYFNEKDNVVIFSNIFKKIDEDLQILSSIYRLFVERQKKIEQKVDDYFENIEPYKEDLDYYNSLNPDIVLFDENALPEKASIVNLKTSYFIGHELNYFINKRDLFIYVNEFKNKINALTQDISNLVYVITGIDCIEKYKCKNNMFSTIVAFKTDSLENIPEELETFEIPEDNYLLCKHSGGLQGYSQTLNYIYFEFLKAHNLEVGTSVNIAVHDEKDTYFMVPLEKK